MIVGLGFSIRSLLLAIRLSTPVPMGDQWEFVADLIDLNDGQYDVWRLFAQHNEHRIFTSRLNFLIDYYFFHLGNLSVVLTNYLVLGMIAGVLTLLATRGNRLGIKLAAFSCALATFWSLAGWINLGWAFQIQWAYVHLFPALTLVCFAAAARRRGAACLMALAAACLCDGLGAFSMASGLCTVVPVVALAIWLHAGLRLIGIFCVWHAVVVFLFLWGYEPPPQELVLDPIRMIRYIAPYLGTVLPGTIDGAIVLGNIGLAVVAVAIAVATWTSSVRRRPIEPGAAVLLAIAVFAVAEGCANAFGRAGLPDSVFLAVRYGTPSEVFWSALLFCGWRVAWRSGGVLASRGLAAAALAGIVVSNMAGSSASLWAESATRSDNIGFDLVNGVSDGPAMLVSYPRPAQIQERFAFVRDHQLGPFAAQEARFRAPVNSVGGVDAATLPLCVGVSDPPARDLEGNVHLRGWGMTPGRIVPPSWVLAYSTAGRLVGFGTTWSRRFVPRSLAGRSVVPSYDTWVNLKDGVDAASLRLVMVFPGGKVPPCLAPRAEAAAPNDAPPT